jgi:hypothetical protein
VKFRITHHTGHGGAVPPDALDELIQRLGAVRNDVEFSRSPTEIAATWNGYTSSSMTEDERIELGRRAILELVRDVCEEPPPLDVEWFAISKMPDHPQTW